MKTLENGTWWAPKRHPYSYFRFTCSHRSRIRALQSMHFSVFCQKCAAYTCTNLKKRTPGPDKKLRNVRSLSLFHLLPVIFLPSLRFLSELFCLLAFCGGLSSCVSHLPWGDPASVSDETRETRNLEKQQNWWAWDRDKDRDRLILFSNTLMLHAFS